MTQANASTTFIGCAGWSLSSAVAPSFPGTGSHLERYAQVLTGVEINSCFYRPHRPVTYARWRDAVPPGFRFSAKVPKAITHEARLQDCAGLLQKFLQEAGCLDEKLGCLLVQLPPRLAYHARTVQQFFDTLRGMTSAPVVCEARHLSWFTDEVAARLADFGVTQVIADPEVAPLPDAAWQGALAYIRLHGSPEMYHSAYTPEYLDTLAKRIGQRARDGLVTWCVFDNTASGAAVPDALYLMDKLGLRTPALLDHT